MASESPNWAGGPRDRGWKALFAALILLALAVGAFFAYAAIASQVYGDPGAAGSSWIS